MRPFGPFKMEDSVLTELSDQEISERQSILERFLKWFDDVFTPRFVISFLLGLAIMMVIVTIACEWYYGPLPK